MPIGQCRLCTNVRELQDSHLMPAGFYTILREDTSGEHPVLIAKNSAFLSSVQARAHLLCSECEGRFNREGENWVIENCWHGPGNFQLHSALMSAQPFLDEEGFRAYEGRRIPGVDLDRLTYFAASMFWRASVHDWRLGKGQPERIALGPYEDRLRRYLLGETHFPDGVALFITVSKALDGMHNRLAAFPWFFNRTREYKSYKCMVPGLTYQMFFGQLIPPGQRRICSARQGFIYMTEGGDAQKLKTMAVMSKRATRRGKLRQEPHSSTA